MYLVFTSCIFSPLNFLLYAAKTVFSMHRWTWLKVKFSLSWLVADWVSCHVAMTFLLTSQLIALADHQYALHCFFNPLIKQSICCCLKVHACYMRIMCLITSHSVSRNTLHLWETSLLRWQIQIMNANTKIIYYRCMPHLLCRKTWFREQTIVWRSCERSTQHAVDIILLAQCPAFLTAWVEINYTDAYF